MTDSNHLKPPLISLFCGPGGLDEGFKQPGYVTRLAYDIEPYCVRTHIRNHPDALALQADLSQIKVRSIVDEWNRRSVDPPVGILGGPPCQSFSLSNRYKRENDLRDMLPRHYARILRGLNEAYDLDFFVFENVPGLLDDDHLPVYDEFKDLADDAGFHVYERQLDAANFGVPQTRLRVFIVGLNKSRYSRRFEFPEPEEGPVQTVRQAIGHLGEPVHFRRNLTPELIEEMSGHSNHWCMKPRSDKFKNGALTPGKIMGRSFRVLSWDRPSYTVAYGHREVHVHPNCRRRLSIHEAMLLQAFPPEYELIGTLSDQVRMISDAVAPPVARALASALMDQLNLNKRMQERSRQHRLNFTTVE